jgi:glycosyltransferase involved in cell wall biosynthesis
MLLSIVVPIYNEAEVLALSHGRIMGIADSLVQNGAIDDYEVIYVDDGSTDETISILKRISDLSERFKILSFSRNFGHQPALAAGIIYSSGDAVVSLDADLQDPPELIEEMLKKFCLGNDIVYAVRKSRVMDTAFKRTSARFFYNLMKLLGVDIIYDHADYRLISQRVVGVFRTMTERNIFLRGIFPYLGFKHDVVFYDRQERCAGETKYPFFKMLSFAWDGITSFSIIPLRVASFTGFLISLSSVALLFWALYLKFAGKTVPGWTSMAMPLFFMGGLNLLFLGLIGEYLGKIYIEVKNRPIFIVRDRYNFRSSASEVKD